VPRLASRIDTGSPEYAASRAATTALLDTVEAAMQQVRAGGSERAVTRHRERGKLMVRERVDLLLDRGSPFLEIAPLAGWGSDDPLGGGVVAGIGRIAGTWCVVSGNDPTVKGGAQSPTSVRKVLRVMEVARENRLPMVNLTETAGADLPKQADVFVPGGAVFRELTQMSAHGIPTVTLVFGSSTAGGAYLPGLSDHTVLQRGSAKVFLGGPPLVKMAINEDADEEELGGAEMHARRSGLADHLAVDERDALRLGRRIVRHLRHRALGPGPATTDPEPPVYDPDELLGIAPADLSVPYDVREVIARVVDGSELDEVKPLYGDRLVCGWAQIGGYPVGILANNGILFSEESQKGAQFIQMANRSDTPLVFLQNITGFMVGTRYEQGGIIKHGSMLVNAVANSTVPHLTMMLGASYGAGNYGMSGRAYRPRLLFTWPQHRIAVMGGRQLAGVVSMVARGKAESAGQPYDDEADAAMRAAVEDQIDAQSTALFATGRLWDDGIIDPRDTRTVLTLSLAAVHSAPVAGTSTFGLFRM
jgi:acetyl-CoA carboxylase carboxyltransferase component